MKSSLSASVFRSLLIMFMIVMLGSVLTTILFQFTDLSERNMPYFTYTINAISLLIGGWITGRKAGGKGWLYGGITGVSYSILLLIIAFLAFDASFSMRSFFTFLACFAISAIGGIFGVNTVRQ